MVCFRTETLGLVHIFNCNNVNRAFVLLLICRLDRRLSVATLLLAMARLDADRQVTPPWRFFARIMRTFDANVRHRLKAFSVSICATARSLHARAIGCIATVVTDLGHILTPCLIEFNTAVIPTQTQTRTQQRVVHHSCQVQLFYVLKGQHALSQSRELFLKFNKFWCSIRRRVTSNVAITKSYGSLPQFIISPKPCDRQ